MTASSPSAARAAVDQLEGPLARYIAAEKREAEGRDQGPFELTVAAIGLAQSVALALPHLLAAIKGVDELADQADDDADAYDSLADSYRSSNMDVDSERCDQLARHHRTTATRIRAALALAAVDVTETAE